MYSTINILWKHALYLSICLSFIHLFNASNFLKNFRVNWTTVCIVFINCLGIRILKVQCFFLTFLNVKITHVKCRIWSVHLLSFDLVMFLCVELPWEIFYFFPWQNWIARTFFLLSLFLERKAQFLAIFCNNVSWFSGAVPISDIWPIILQCHWKAKIPIFLWKFNEWVKWIGAITEMHVTKIWVIREGISSFRKQKSTSLCSRIFWLCVVCVILF